MTQDLTVGKPISRIWQFAVPVLFGLLLANSVHSPTIRQSENC